jgi:transcriptional regulator with XRE-family HTH domain
MSNNILLERGKVVVALRTARAAAGWNQEEFAQLMGVAKTTVARIETLEMSAKAEYLSRALRLFREVGIEVDLSEIDNVPIKVSMLAVAKAVDDLSAVTRQRSLNLFPLKWDYVGCRKSLYLHKPLSVKRFLENSS